MKSIQIGKLIFHKKAILAVTFCLFLNGVIIGALLAAKQLDDISVSIFIIMPLLFLPYVLLRKRISSNIQEIN
ncbi:hypothetical protein [Polaribacter sp. IC063]|uniref:hypothetical protein n=1 Tax=Polaribacter sp. IC063 TaxID=57031 RepID=UPI0011BD9C12|nr:hypothetical protein [Polaribacter sp. IC063]TXD53936.1 hypothetical protein ES043_02605 [Polaribacter sp. IC063]